MKNDGGSVFPNTITSDMSLRDWLAGMALNGLLSCTQQPGITFEQYALDSYTLADAMLNERSKE